MTQLEPKDALKLFDALMDNVKRNTAEEIAAYLEQIGLQVEANIVRKKYSERAGERECGGC